MIRVPGDKSISHRALLLAAVARGESRLRGVLPGEDCQATARCMRAMGAHIPALPADGSEIRVEGVGLRGLRHPDQVLDCGNSGTTARLLLGLLTGAGVRATLTGDDSLRARPMRRVTEPLVCAGGRFVELGEEDRLPIRLEGGGGRPPSAGPLEAELAVASAQLKSALLLAGLTGDFEVVVKEPGRSRDHTERMLRQMGVTVGTTDHRDGSRTVHLPPRPDGAFLRPLDLEVPGDLSSAAFLMALGLLREGGPLELGNVGLNSTRTGILPVLRRMGARLEVRDLRDSEGGAGEPAGTVEVHPSRLQATDVTPSEIPLLLDEVPLLAVLAARARGTTRIRGAEELRVKESDRLAALARNLEALGVAVEEYPDGLDITGSEGPLTGAVGAEGDHRIAMAFGVLGALPGNRVDVDDPAVAAVSYPGFWDRLAELAGP
ncbi:MAG: 3-phosphoshikimate 1-carboxyvinyltransferase [Gemmatimonadales bacterium]|nr:MAG: 3-phosphoshikimate 1-carboxyvinyltransferase [Gemmatimonadales bacterium]